MITDRNLTAGTKLWARYKGATFTAEVISRDDGKGNETLVYQLHGLVDQEFKSPSAMGAAIFGDGRTCNGWSFWTVGEPPAIEKPSAVEKPARAPRTRNAERETLMS